MIRTLATLLCALFLAAPAFADKTHDTEGPLTQGEVRKVEKDARKITIKHEPIESLEMPAMTMAFEVKDPAMLDRVKAGDKVWFAARKLGGAFTVTAIEKAN